MIILMNGKVFIAFNQIIFRYETLTLPPGFSLAENCLTNSNLLQTHIHLLNI